MVILDRQGRLLERVDQRDGLSSPSVYYVMPDREGGLWLALAVGLARVEAQSPFSLYGPANEDLLVIRAIEREGNSVVVKGQAYGTMPLSATLRPEQARS